MSRETVFAPTVSLLFLSIYGLIFNQANATEPVSDAPTQEADGKKLAAINTAKQELSKQLAVDSTTLKLVSAQDHTWPDSSMGCGKPGQAAAQVLTPGYVITLQSSKGTHVVHATDHYAVMCERNLLMRDRRNVGAPLRNIEDMVAAARQDLASKLNTQPALIRTLNFVAAEWPDTSMDCAVDDEKVETKVIKGYRIALNHAGRTYVYHTDMARVRACPAIEAK